LDLIQVKPAAFIIIIVNGIGAWKLDKRGKERVILVYAKTQEKVSLSPKRIISCSELVRI
jgi:hypothetical protein